MLIRTAIVCVLSLLLSGCGVAYSVLLGVDTRPEWKSAPEIARDFRKARIDPGQAFVLDSAAYSAQVLADLKREIQALRRPDGTLDSVRTTSLKAVAKDNLQPVQVRYFDRQGNPIFKMVNCYVDPPIPMNWNVDGCFDVFPPHTGMSQLNAGNQPLDFFLPYIRTLDGDSIARVQLPEADYYALVFWNRFFRRPSKKLIRQLRDYDRSHPDQKTCFLFVNNHNAAIWMHLTPEQKTELNSNLKHPNVMKQLFFALLYLALPAVAFTQTAAPSIIPPEGASFKVIVYRPHDQLRRKFSIRTSENVAFDLQRNEQKVLEIPSETFSLIVDGFGHRRANAVFALEPNKTHYLRLQDRNNYAGFGAFLEVIEVSESTYRKDMGRK